LISPCYGPFSLGTSFENYEPFISLIFQFFGGRSKPRMLHHQLRGHDYIYDLFNIYLKCWALNSGTKGLKTLSLTDGVCGFFSSSWQMQEWCL
jgi:hypothetical protein